jgi:hypothetical protein
MCSSAHSFVCFGGEEKTQGLCTLTRQATPEVVLFNLAITCHV